MQDGPTIKKKKKREIEGQNQQSELRAQDKFISAYKYVKTNNILKHLY